MNNPKDEQSDARVLAMDLLGREYRTDWLAAELHREFTRKDYVRMPALLSTNASAIVKAEVDRLGEVAKSRDFVMEGYETPRVMSTVGGSTILSRSKYLWALYSHFELRTLMQRIVGANIYPCLHANEFMVANYLLGIRSTHGWHLDDPAYALILFIDSPPADAGGLLEFIPNWRELCEKAGASPEENVDPLVEQARTAGLVQARHHSSGDAYLLRADKCLHRVTPLQAQDARRVVLNLAYEATPEPVYGHTASRLYGDD